MFSKLLLLLVGICCSIYLSEGGALVRRELSESDHPEAFCNDGTRPAYFHSEDRDSARGVIVFFQGGLHCLDKEDCVDRCTRRSPNLCTTSSQPYLEERRRRGIMSDNPIVNPAFHDYSKVYFPYCTSDMYAGNRSASDDTGGYQFRGRAVISAVFSSLLETSPLPAATDVLVVGASAGARGVAFNCERIGELLDDSVNYGCLVDGSMFYPDVPTYTPDCLHFNDLVATGNAFWHGDLYNFDVFTWWKIFTRPLFLGFMTHDTYGLRYFCVDSSDSDQLRSWGDAITELAEELVVSAPHVGLYMPACRSHVMADNDYYSQVTTGPKNLEYRKVIENWFLGEAGVIQTWDDCRNQDSPICNSYCAEQTSVFSGSSSLVSSAAMLFYGAFSLLLAYNF